MPTIMTALDSPSIRHAEFIKLTMPSVVYTYTNAAAAVTVSGMTFDNLGSLLQLGDIQRDIKATSDDLTISLTGIDAQNVGMVLSADIKGSIVEVWRGFLDADNQIIQTPTQQFFKRYQGIISSVSITENYNMEIRQRIATCNVSCSSMRQILMNRVAGVKTNPSSWNFLYPGDTSMDRVPVIASTYFDFGAQPLSGSQSVAEAPQNQNEGNSQVSTNDNGGG
jgi:hypothetical protein